MDEEMGERGREIGGKHQLDEQPEPELLAELHQHQVGADIGHDIGGRDPRGFHGGKPERPLEVGEIGGHQRVAEAAGQARQDADQCVG